MSDASPSNLTRLSGTCWIDPAACATTGLPNDAAAAQQWIDRALAASRTPTKTFKNDARSSVIRFELNGRDWILKTYHLTAIKNAITHLLAATPAWREWGMARHLAERGLAVVQPLALVHRPGCAAGDQALIMPSIPGRSLFLFARDRSIPATHRRTVARLVGQQIAQLLAAGFVNRDHKGSNILIPPGCETGSAQPVLIDPVGIRRKRSDAQLHRMLAILADSIAGLTLRESLACLQELRTADEPDTRTARLRRHTLWYGVQSCRNAARDTV